MGVRRDVKLPPLPPGIAGAPDLTEMLMEKEDEAVREKLRQHKIRIGKVILEVEKVLIDNGITLNELTEVVTAILKRNNHIVDKLTIKEIKERYDNELNTKPRGADVQPSEGSPSKG